MAACSSMSVQLDLVAVRWPHLADAHALPLYEGVTLSLLTATSLLAFAGVRYPIKLLPLLLVESAWKLLWLALVALPRALAGNVDAATFDGVVNCSLVVVILAVTPWRYVWKTYLRAPGDRRLADHDRRGNRAGRRRTPSRGRRRPPG
jgi:hypothetical protein